MTKDVDAVTCSLEFANAFWQLYLLGKVVLKKTLLLEIYEVSSPA